MNPNLEFATETQEKPPVLPQWEAMPAVSDDAASLGALVHLFRDLGQQGVRYCHWKSNVRLERALAGKTDLDLLVDRTHAERFRQILAAYAIKPVLAAPGKAYPGVENYLGLDPASGRLFHLHVHYQLVLGEQFVKNYRLPLAAQLLDSARLYRGVLVPAPAWELIILSLRALLKYRDRDAVKDLLSIRQPGLPSYILQEIHWLLAQTSLEQVAETLAQTGDLLPRTAVLDFLRTVAANPRAGWSFYRLRGQVRRALRPYQRTARLHAASAYLFALGRRSRWARRFRTERKMTSRAGGQSLALVGADGAGKSTLCAAIAPWLAWKLDVRSYYLGSKAPSHPSRLLYWLFRAARRGHHMICQRWGEKSFGARVLLAARQTLRYSHHLSIAYDRYQRYRDGQQQAARGSVVLYDRYPLATLLDGPKIHGETTGPAWLARTFSRLEQRLYQRIQMPDCLLVLDVDPAVSLQRKPDHDLAAIEAKSRALHTVVRQIDAGGSACQLVYIDANQPLDQVLHQLKMSIWQRI